MTGRRWNERGENERGGDECESEDKSRRKQERKGIRHTWDSTRCSTTRRRTTINT
jgi:hypothetical protein